MAVAAAAAGFVGKGRARPKRGATRLQVLCGTCCKRGRKKHESSRVSSGSGVGRGRIAAADDAAAGGVDAAVSAVWHLL